MMEQNKMTHKKINLKTLEDTILKNDISNDSIKSCAQAIADVKNAFTFTDLSSLKNTIDTINEKKVDYTGSINGSHKLHDSHDTLYKTLEHELSIRENLSVLSKETLFTQKNDIPYLLSDMFKRVNLYSRYNTEILSSDDLLSFKSKMRELYFAKPKEKRTKEDLSSYRSSVATLNAMLRKKEKMNGSSHFETVVSNASNVFDISSSSKIPNNSLAGPIADSDEHIDTDVTDNSEDSWVGKTIEDELTEDERGMLSIDFPLSEECTMVRKDKTHSFFEESFYLRGTEPTEDLKTTMPTLDAKYAETVKGTSLAERRILRDATNDLKADLRNSFYTLCEKYLGEIDVLIESGTISEEQYESSIEHLAVLQHATKDFDKPEVIRRQEIEQKIVFMATKLHDESTIEELPKQSMRRYIRPLRVAVAALSVALVASAYAMFPNAPKDKEEFHTQIETQAYVSTYELPSQISNKYSSVKDIIDFISEKKISAENNLSDSLKQKNATSKTHTVLKNESFIGIAEKEYCGQLSGLQKGHCSVDFGIGLAEINKKIDAYGKISLHKGNILSIPSQESMKDYVQKYEKRLHTTFQKWKGQYTHK